MISYQFSILSIGAQTSWQQIGKSIILSFQFMAFVFQ